MRGNSWRHEQAPRSDPAIEPPRGKLAESNWPIRFSNIMGEKRELLMRHIRIAFITLCLQQESLPPIVQFADKARGTPSHRKSRQAPFRRIRGFIQHYTTNHLLRRSKED